MSLLPLNFASILLVAAIFVALVPPGYSAYIGSYAAMLLSVLALLLHAWKQRDLFRTPSALAIMAAIALVALSVPFIYVGPQDVLAPVLLLPMLCALGIAVLALPASKVPSATLFAAIGLGAALIAFVAGSYEYYVLGIPRPGLGNNPIHYGTLATMAGGMAMIGIVASRSPWRYLFLLGPIFGLGCAMLSGSRGPMLGALAMLAAAAPFLIRWFWRERLFGIAALACTAAGAIALAVLFGSGNQRALSLFTSALDVFRFTGSGDDIRAGLYLSSLDALKQSPLFGHGLGQIMDTVRAIYPELPEIDALENLHADWANFSVMAGGLGLVSYLLLLATPLLLLTNPIARQDRPIVLGAVLAVAGQLALGLSNAMFGILPQTVMYAAIVGYLMARARRLQTEAHNVH